ALYPRAIERASRLLAELGGGRVGPVVNRPGTPPWAGDRAITLELGSVGRLLGQAVAADEIERILNALGMTLEATGEATWRVVPPSWRYDIAIEADLIEEVARVHGYDRLLEHAGGTVLPAIRLPETRLTEDEVLDTLRQRGYSE